ncbi:MAG: hypothetical protein ACFCUI_08290 [Bernardetiaceae bacterium]
MTTGPWVARVISEDAAHEIFEVKSFVNDLQVKTLFRFFQEKILKKSESLRLKKLWESVIFPLPISK